MLEANLNKKAVEALNKMPGVFVKKRWSGPQQRGQPDITGICWGRRIEIEGKLPGNKPTKLQTHWLKTWEKYGAITGVYHSVTEAVALVEPYSRCWRKSK